MKTLTGQLLLCDTPSTVRIAPGYVRLRDGHVAEVVEGEISNSADAGDANTFICPGFLDAHLHLPQFDMMGAHGLALLDWLSDVTFPMEQRWQDASYASEMTNRVLQQLLSVGTTSICAYATVHHQSAIAALQVANDLGMRGVIGQVLMDRQAPDYLCHDRKALIDQAKQTLEAFPPGARMSAAVTPRFAVSCTPELLADAGELARESDAVVQTHLAETKRECDFVKELFGGTDYVQVYKDNGLLTGKAIFGHGIHLSKQDRHALKQSGSVIAHCPTANSFLRSGIMNRKLLLDDGVSLAVGSDIGAGYERSMVRVARAMIESASARSEEYPTAAEAWHRVTAGTADAIGWPDVGRIAEGVPADLVVVRPDIPWLQDAVDPLSMLLFAWDDRWIKQTLLRGEVCYQNG